MAKVRSRDTLAKYDQILGELKNKIYRPVYLLAGEEPYYIDEISNYITENILAENEKAFNLLIMYGKDTDARSIVFAAARPPMMANYQVVVIREAQSLKLDDLEAYLKSPLSTTILVICMKGKSPDKRTKIYKEIEKKGIILESVKLYDNELPAWIKSYAKKIDKEIEPDAAIVLGEYIGSNLSAIVGELDKLSLLLPIGNKKITLDHIEKNIGISKDYNVFELNKALFSKDILRVNRIVDYFGKNPGASPMVMTISSLFSQFSKLLKYHVLKRKEPNAQSYKFASELGIDPFFLKEYESASTKYPPQKVIQIISLLREYDMKSKGWNSAGVSDGETLRELVFKILH